LIGDYYRAQREGVHDDELLLSVQFGDQQNIVEQKHSSNFHYFSACAEREVALNNKLIKIESSAGQFSIPQKRIFGAVLQYLHYSIIGIILI
jgi:hypothetical protein